MHKSMMNEEAEEEENMNKWLGFSLSPHIMKMEAANNNNSTSTCSDPNFNHHSLYLHSNSHINNNNNTCYGGVAENGHEFHYSPLSMNMMPLKSDGSLCIMEALSKSHSPQAGGMVSSSSSSPKLEDFLGSGATMAAHDYGAHFLSLDSMFYSQHPPFRHQNYYSSDHALNSCTNNALIYQTTNENTTTTQIPPQMSSDETEIMKTWIDNNQHAVLEQHHQINNHNNNGDLQSLSLSMSPGSQSSCITASRQTHETTTAAATTKKRGSEKLMGQQKQQTVHRKSIDTFGQRTSQYRGVTRHRWTGRYEAHLWDNSCKKEGQTRKGRQGGYDMEEKAARAYDLAALKYWGPSTHINFSVYIYIYMHLSIFIYDALFFGLCMLAAELYVGCWFFCMQLENYHQELEEMKNMSRQEYVAHLRRKSSGFSRGASIYRGVTRHHQHGRWQARIGRVAGNKDLYLGTFSTQEEAAEAYDIAAIKFRGVNAVTNFDISRYDVEKIMASNTLPTGDIARRTKEEKQPNAEASFPQVDNVGTDSSDWKMVIQNQAPRHQENVTIGTMTAGNYQNPPFSVGLHDLTGVEVDEQRTSVAQHFSNPSSLVTSLSSSREPSPDKNGAPILFSTKFISPSSNVNSWIPTAQLRPSVPLTTAHLPLFAAWNDV
ncbi:hypothetical protein BUALT_Bualt08G0033800 [Buddleja alternifolia]|uniref:AP2/ERF domain-containing protein n=1 Tax=Buddleja alternifolia TaxID=168488 RepID=A0AAV6XBU9_9LAMI|nr:hypothetical protein BUALT_Bualt08G0033800 [Buddleja alternifolia]